MFTDILVMLRTQPASVSRMRSCALLLPLLGGFVLNTHAGLALLPTVQVKEITIRVENSSLEYPESLVLVPGNFPDEQRHLLFHQVRRDVTDNRLTTDNLDGDVRKVVETVLRAADQVLKADNNTASGVGNVSAAKRESAPMTVYLVGGGDSRTRSRPRSRMRRSARLVRAAYTRQWQDLCDSCPALTPQHPVVINIIKTGNGCGNGCSPPQSKPTSCGHPQCESHFQPHHFMFHPPPPPHFHHHPPPPPPPHFHHYPPPPPPPHFHNYPPQPAFNSQPVVTPKPKQPARPQPSPSHNTCDPCARPASQPPAAAAPNFQPQAAAPSFQPQAAAPNFGGSFSQSSASAQSSSFAWNG